MPICVLTTNLKNSDIPDGFEVQLSHKIGEVLNKPIERITVSIHPDNKICRNGDTSPMCLLNISAIKVFDEERNPVYTEKLSEFLKSGLNLPGNRVILLYTAIDPHMWGSGK